MTPRRVLLAACAVVALIVCAVTWISARRGASGPASLQPTHTALPAGGTSGSAETSLMAAAAPAKIAARFEQVRPRDLAAEQQELREFGLRNFAIDYGPFFGRSALPRAVTDLLLRVLSEQFLSQTDSEAQEYEKMIAELLGNKYPEFAAYRDRLPREKQADAGLQALQRGGRSVPPDIASALRQGLADIPVNNSTYRAILAQPIISDADLDRVRSEFVTAFDRSMNGLIRDQSAAYVRSLRDWYLSDGIAKQMKILQIQQAMLAGKPFPQ